MAIYDNEQNDDVSHEHVVRARAAGRAWAQREVDALDAAAIAGTLGVWFPSANDALPLVRFDPSSDVEDQVERERELAEICNEAAREEFALLAQPYLDDASRYEVCWNHDGGDAAVSSSHDGLSDARTALHRLDLGRGDTAWIWDTRDEERLDVREAGAS